MLNKDLQTLCTDRERRKCVKMFKTNNWWFGVTGNVRDCKLWMVSASKMLRFYIKNLFNKRLKLGCSPPLWDNRPDSLIMAWGPEAWRTLLGWKVDYLIMAACNQVINVFNTNALQNQIPVDPNVLSPFNVIVFF